ncbi:hypothetical protein [Sulfurimonas sp.]|uniref:hypothetical protein n=1 Tax=Sulfurimonas sp. TaxID=2022749 RepID=UPI0025E0110F|nr:hypothetical protein [Sulfurimonas sp.]MDD5157012.1 hypothetical protein [Sulfurimonas sp.]
MFKIMARSIYALLIFIGVVGGVWSFYNELVSLEDYKLSLFLKSEEKLIENEHSNIGLTMAYNGVGINSLYLTKYTLKNTGKRALTRDYIYEPIQISIGNKNSILKVTSNNHLLTHTNDSITIKWDLFNPDESINVLIFSTEPIKLNIHQKIKEIKTITFVNEIKNPTITKRFKSINIIWYLLMIFAMLITIDGLFLIKNDSKLDKIFAFLKSLPTLKSIEKEDYFSELKKLYEDYYNSAPLLFVKPNDLKKLISAYITPLETISDFELVRAKQEGINYVRNANLYNIRTQNILFGPILFIISFIAIIVLLFLPSFPIF